MNGRLRRTPLAVLAASLLAATAMPGTVAAAGPLCVGGSGCYSSVQAAVDAAHDGDVIEINPGTYDGGVTIPVSIRLAGAGADVTIIDGGGPVLTIGTYGADTEPTVLIDGLTISGGVTRTSAQSLDWTGGQDGVVALGGGIEIPPNSDYSSGATVTVRNSVVTGNRVATMDTVPWGPPCPGDTNCPFSLAAGGGIDSWGTLTLVNTTVADNLVGTASGLEDSDLGSDVQGGGIMSWSGPVTIRNSHVTGNTASASAPNGRYVVGGGILLEGGTFDMKDSSVSGNTSALAAAFPDDVDMHAIGGGIHLAENVSRASIRGSSIDGNTVSMTNSLGSTDAWSGGLHLDWGVPFQMSNTSISYNNVTSTTVGGTSPAFGDSGAGEMHGDIEGAQFVGNTVAVTSIGGDAIGAAGVSIFFGTITNSLVQGNGVDVSSPSGSAWANGGALLADEGGMTLRSSTVSDNTINVSGSVDAVARGGGIYDSPIPDGPPGGPLVLVNSRVTGNALTGSGNATLEGGGLYVSDVPVTLTHSAIQDNEPDDCAGC